MSNIMCFIVGLIMAYIIIMLSTGKPKRKKKVQYLKVIVACVMIHGMILSTMSYILAIMDKNTVYEVSTVIITEIIAPVMLYGITKTVENIFEKNKLNFSTPLGVEQEEVSNE